ncbi:MAG TPA: glycosyltransferase, partial [Candidatus Acetothermia bacterium]|nr:glycosyltransferase [Candidatus Acetothermia bacterium]
MLQSIIDNKNDKILVSVAIPAYNEEDCIADCLRSIARQQTSVDVEAVVCLNA